MEVTVYPRLSRIKTANHSVYRKNVYKKLIDIYVILR